MERPGGDHSGAFVLSVFQHRDKGMLSNIKKVGNSKSLEGKAFSTGCVISRRNSLPHDVVEAKDLARSKEGCDVRVGNQNSQRIKCHASEVKPVSYDLVLDETFMCVDDPATTTAGFLQLPLQRLALPAVRDGILGWMNLKSDPAWHFLCSCAVHPSAEGLTQGFHPQCTQRGKISFLTTAARVS